MKKRYVLNFPPKVVEVPLIYNIIRNYDIKVNILRANVSSNEEGQLLLEMEGADDNIEKSLDFIRQSEVMVKPLENSISFEKTLCIHCGACTAVCFPGALSMDKTTWKLIFEPEKCVVCKLCTKACPLGLFAIEFD